MRLVRWTGRLAYDVVVGLGLGMMIAAVALTGLHALALGLSVT